MKKRKGWPNRGRRALAIQTMFVLTTAIGSHAAFAASDDDDSYTNPGWSDRLSDSLKESIGSASKKIGLGKAAPPPPPEAPSGCPTISILPGTESQRVTAPGTTGNQGLRYQYSLMTVGRECSISAGRVSIKVGADGRVLLGPAGAAGHYDVPIRVAIYSEAQQKPVESKLFKLAISINAGQAGAPFNFVSDPITVSIPPGHSGEYSIKIGFDGGKGGPADAAKPKRAHRQKPAAATASASQ